MHRIVDDVIELLVHVPQKRVVLHAVGIGFQFVNEARQNSVVDLGLVLDGLDAEEDEAEHQGRCRGSRPPS